jgi:ATP-dependent protease ClpP protease subunit
MATQIVGALLALEAMDENEDIRLYINSPGRRRCYTASVLLAATVHAARERGAGVQTGSSSP